MDYRRQLEPAVRGLAFRSAVGFSWLGRPGGRVASAAPGLTPERARRYAVAAITGHLYAHFYCRGEPVATAPGGSWPSGEAPRLAGRTPFVDALSAANGSAGSRDRGWEVRAVDPGGGTVVVRKHGLELRARAAECLPPPEAALAPGARVALRVPNELLALSPGFYTFQGADALGEGGAGVVRLYWHLGARGAAAFVRGVRAAMDGAALPFRAKVLRDPALYGRRDAAVVYVGAPDYDAAAERLAAVRRRLSAFITPGAPAFTKELAPGVGVAEDPGPDASFGEHRCRLVAEGLVRARGRRRRGVPARMREVEARFSEAGLTLDAPFLNAGSSDRYHRWTAE